MKSIPLGAKQKYFTFVSDEDFEYLTRWKWCWKTSARKYRSGVYAKRTGPNDEAIYVAHIVLELKGERKPHWSYEADHVDTDTLNNTRENLRWLPRKINRKRRK